MTNITIGALPSLPTQLVGTEVLPADQVSGSPTGFTTGKLALTQFQNFNQALKLPVRVATTGANIALSGLQTIDGQTLIAGDRVLVKDQTSQPTNGIYVAAAGAWSLAADFAASAMIMKGTLVNVLSGTVNAGQFFEQTTANPTLGSSNIVFVNNNFAGDAGAGGSAGLVPAPPAGSGAADQVLKANGNWGVVGLTNVRLAKTTTYNVANADKGKTIACGGATLWTLTFPAASGFDADFAVLVTNEDTGRAKSIVLTGGPTFFLWPLQSILIFNQNNVWQSTGRSRWLLTASTTFNVDPVNGSDTNDGLATGTGAFLTMQACFNMLVANIDLCSFVCTIQLANTGTFTTGLTINTLLNGQASTAGLTIAGPATIASTQSCLLARNGAKFACNNLTLSSSAANCIDASDPGSKIVIGLNVSFGATASGAHIQAVSESLVQVNGNYSMNSGGAWHMRATTNAVITVTAGITVTLSAGPTFNVQFADADQLGNIQAVSVTYSGAATGVRYISNANSVINTGGGGANYFPGSVAGSVTNQGLYL